VLRRVLPEERRLHQEKEEEGEKEDRPHRLLPLCRTRLRSGRRGSLHWQAMRDRRQQLRDERIVRRVRQRPDLSGRRLRLRPEQQCGVCWKSVRPRGQQLRRHDIVRVM
jgi:hypothetical protein